MNNFRQLNRSYENMLENQYQAELEAAEHRLEFIDNLVEEYQANSWSDQLELLSIYMELYDFETAD